MEIQKIAKGLTTSQDYKAGKTYYFASECVCVCVFGGVKDQSEFGINMRVDSEGFYCLGKG